MIDAEGHHRNALRMALWDAFYPDEPMPEPGNRTPRYSREVETALNAVWPYMESYVASRELEDALLDIAFHHKPVEISTGGGHDSFEIFRCNGVWAKGNWSNLRQRVIAWGKAIRSRGANPIPEFPDE